MIGLIIKRVLQGIPVILGVMTISFLLMNVFYLSVIFLNLILALYPEHSISEAGPGVPGPHALGS